MALSKQQQQQVVLAVMLVAGFGYVYWNYMLSPANKKIAELNTNLTEVLDKVETMKRTANRLPALQKEYEGLLAEVGKSEKRLPKEKNLQEVLRLVTEHSLRQQITVRSFTPGAEVPQNYFVEVPVVMSVSGQFHTLGKFLALMGQQERILSAKNLSLSVAPLGNKKNDTIQGTFTLLAYIFKG